MGFKKHSGHKYGAKRCVIDGVRFDSKLEGEFYGFLKNWHTGSLQILELQPKIYMTKARVLYKPDFEIIKDGETIWIDVKGMTTPMFNLKVRLWKHYGPGRLQIVKKTRGRFNITKEIVPITKE